MADEIKKKRTRKKRIVSTVKTSATDTVIATNVQPPVNTPVTDSVKPPVQTVANSEPLPPIIPEQVVQNLRNLRKPAKKSGFDLMDFLGLKSSKPISPKVNIAPAIKTQRIGGRKWWLIAIGAAVMVLGFVGVFSYIQNMSAMVGFISVVGLIGGGTAMYFGWKSNDEAITFASNNPLDKSRDKNFIANSMNIYPNQLKFESLPENALLGQPRLCRNDKKFYYIHMEGTAFKGKESGKLIPFALPDTQYRDPREFANNLNIPAHRRLAQRKANLFEKLSPLIIIGAMIIIGIVWVATSPAPAMPGVVSNSTIITPISQQVGK
jgi:hypothetical protein